MSFKVVFTAVAMLCAGNAMAQAELGPGQPVPTLSLSDQHEQPYSLPSGTGRLLFVADNAGTELATQLIERHDAGWLARSQTVFVADIHKMPSLVARFVALPRLREKPYRILLGRDAPELAMFPRKKGCVTVIAVSKGSVSELAYACTAEELAATERP